MAIRVSELNGEAIRHIKTHNTKDIRRIVRQYKYQNDCTESKVMADEFYVDRYILKPTNGASWRLVIREA